MKPEDKSGTPEDMFKPSEKYPQGSSGEWTAEENERRYNTYVELERQLAEANRKIEKPERKLAEANRKIEYEQLCGSELEQQLADAQAQSARRLEGLCKCGIEKDQLRQQLTTANSAYEMKFYTDLEGKIEAQPGDLVALAVSEYGGMLHQPEVSKRPRLSDDGKSVMFDWKEGEGGPFMVSLEE